MGMSLLALRAADHAIARRKACDVANHDAGLGVVLGMCRAVAETRTVSRTRQHACLLKATVEEKQCLD